MLLINVFLNISLGILFISLISMIKHIFLLKEHPLGLSLQTLETIKIAKA